ncbi:aldehyde dehydrogenase family protein [Nocardia thraciensis]
MHESVYPAFRDRFVERVSALRVGPGYGFDVEMGGLVSADQLDRVAAQVNQARGDGARVLTGGRARPVVALYSFSTVDEAVARTNDTRFGLSASVWGRDLSAAGPSGSVSRPDT